jgi:hypothetical protein
MPRRRRLAGLRVSHLHRRLLAPYRFAHLLPGLLTGLKAGKGADFLRHDAQPRQGLTAPPVHGCIATCPTSIHVANHTPIPLPYKGSFFENEVIDFPPYGILWGVQ